MKRHSTDMVSLVFGLIFAGVAGWWLLGRYVQGLNLNIPHIGVLAAGALILLGLLGVAGSLRRDRAPVADAPTSGTPFPTSGAPSPTSGTPFPTSGASVFDPPLTDPLLVDNPPADTDRLPTVDSTGLPVADTGRLPTVDASDDLAARDEPAHTDPER